jgi:universal stress protein F
MYKNILVPVIFDEEHDTQASYMAAKTLADDGAVFTVIHVLEDIPAYVVAEIPNEVLAATRQEVTKALAQSAKALPGARTELISGHSGKTIVDYADANNNDCIVVASHKPSIGDFFLGSTASRVVQHAKCAVHIIR